MAAKQTGKHKPIPFVQELPELSNTVFELPTYKQSLSLKSPLYRSSEDNITFGTAQINEQQQVRNEPRSEWQKPYEETKSVNVRMRMIYWENIMSHKYSGRQKQTCTHEESNKCCLLKFPSEIKLYLCFLEQRQLPRNWKEDSSPIPRRLADYLLGKKKVKMVGFLEEFHQWHAAKVCIRARTIQHTQKQFKKEGGQPENEIFSI